MSRINIVEKGKRYDKDLLKSIFGDFDNDGIINIDDVAPLNSKIKGKVEQQVSMGDVFESVLDLRQTLQSQMNEIVDQMDDFAPEDAQIYARTKTPFSIFKKLVDKRLLDENKGLTDLVGTTIAVDDFDDLITVKESIEKGALGEVLDFEDYYSTPKGGYRAFHYIVRFNGFPMEIQLKTKRQKEINEMSHDFYKAGTLNAEYMKYLTELAVKADEGDIQKQREFDRIIKLKTTRNKLGNMKKGGSIYNNSQKFAKGGSITEKPVEVKNFGKNLLGTVDFDMKIKGMQRFQNWSVYPISADEKNPLILIQSDKRFAYISPKTGRGISSITGNTSVYLQKDLVNGKATYFKLTGDQLEQLKTEIRKTSSANAGNYFITSDNSGADKLKKGGKVSEVGTYAKKDLAEQVAKEQNAFFKKTSQNLVAKVEGTKVVVYQKLKEGGKLENGGLIKTDSGNYLHKPSGYKLEVHLLKGEEDWDGSTYNEDRYVVIDADGMMISSDHEPLDSAKYTLFDILEMEDEEYKKGGSVLNGAKFNAKKALNELFSMSDLINPELKSIKTTDEWILESKFDGGGVTESKIMVDISSDYNYDVELALTYDWKGNLVDAIVRDRIDEWEYDVEDVEEIGGFENDKPSFKQIVSIVTKAVKKTLIGKNFYEVPEYSQELKDLAEAIYESVNENGKVKWQWSDRVMTKDEFITWLLEKKRNIRDLEGLKKKKIDGYFKMSVYLPEFVKTNKGWTPIYEAERMLDELRTSFEYQKGGKIKRSKSAINKDRKYTSNEKHEQRYAKKRKSAILRYLEKGGKVEQKLSKAVDNIVNALRSKTKLRSEVALNPATENSSAFITIYVGDDLTKLEGFSLKGKSPFEEIQEIVESTIKDKEILRDIIYDESDGIDKYSYESVTKFRKINRGWKTFPEKFKKGGGVEEYSLSQYLKDYASNIQDNPYGKGSGEFEVEVIDNDGSDRYFIWGESEEDIRKDILPYLRDDQAINVEKITYSKGGELKEGNVVRYNGYIYIVHSVESNGKINLHNPYKGYMMEYLVDPKDVEFYSEVPFDKGGSIKNDKQNIKFTYHPEKDGIDSKKVRSIAIEVLADHGNWRDVWSEENVFEWRELDVRMIPSNKVRELKSKLKKTFNIDDDYFKISKGQYAEGGRVLVGRFNEQQLKNKEDKKAIEKAQKESGLTYIDSKIIKKGGKMFMEVYLIPNEEYYASSKFNEGGDIFNKLNQKEFENWINEGNALEIEDGIWIEQTTQWKKRFTLPELKEFYIREFVNYENGGKVPYPFKKVVETDEFEYYMDLPSGDDDVIMIRKSDGEIISDNYMAENALYEDILANKVTWSTPDMDYNIREIRKQSIMKFGGKTKLGWKRDRIWTSKEPHEQAYKKKRKSAIRNHAKDKARNSQEPHEIAVRKMNLGGRTSSFYKDLNALKRGLRILKIQSPDAYEALSLKFDLNDLSNQIDKIVKYADYWDSMNYADRQLELTKLRKGFTRNYKKGGKIDANRHFTQVQFDRLTDDIINDFVGEWSGDHWIIKDISGVVRGTWNPTTELLEIKGEANGSNPLVRFIYDNSYLSIDEYDKLAYGGEIVKDADGNMFEILPNRFKNFKVGDYAYNVWIDEVQLLEDEDDVEEANNSYEVVVPAMNVEYRYNNGGSIGRDKWSKVMAEFRNGELRSSSGDIVTDKEQAMAIAYSEARKADKKYAYSDGGSIEETERFIEFWSDQPDDVIVTFLAESNISGLDKIIDMDRTIDDLGNNMFLVDKVYYLPNKDRNDLLELIKSFDDEYGLGGLIVATTLGAYFGYKAGRSMSKSNDVFAVEKKIAKKLKSKAKKLKSE